MIQKKVNRKPMLLLLVLILFAVFSSKKFSEINWQKEEPIYESKPAECTTCKTGDGIQEEIDEDSSLNYVLLDSSQTVDVTNNLQGGVKGVSIFQCRGFDPANFLESKRYTCSTPGSGGIDFANGSASGGGQGVVVSKDTKITITKITFPLALWLGQYTYVDSNKQIRVDSPDYRSNGQQIDPEIVSRTLSPKEAVEFYEVISGTVKKPFVVEGKIKMDTGEVDNLQTEDGKFQVENAPYEPGCIVGGKPCDPKLAVSDYNVGKSNYIGSDEKFGGYLGQQAPGGDKKIVDDGEECIVEGQDYKQLEKGLRTTCDKVVAKINGIFKKPFSFAKWERCTIGEEVTTISSSGTVTTTRNVTKECVDPKTLGIKMAPIFGETDKCDKELCANATLALSYRETLSPSESKGVTVSGNPKTATMFFVATECSLQIDGINVDVLCLWDASPILLNYKLQEKDKAPNQEDFPKNFTTYWTTVHKSMEMSTKVYGLN